MNKGDIRLRQRVRFPVDEGTSVGTVVAVTDVGTLVRDDWDRGLHMVPHRALRLPNPSVMYRGQPVEVVREVGKYTWIDVSGDRKLVETRALQPAPESPRQPPSAPPPRSSPLPTQPQHPGEVFFRGQPVTVVREMGRVAVIELYGERRVVDVSLLRRGAVSQSPQQPAAQPPRPPVTTAPPRTSQPPVTTAPPRPARPVDRPPRSTRSGKERERFRDFVTPPQRVRFAQTVPQQAKELAKQIAEMDRRKEHARDLQAAESAVKRLTEQSIRLAERVVEKVSRNRQALQKQQKSEGLSDGTVSRRLGEAVREVPEFQQLAQGIVPESLPEDKYRARFEDIKRAIVKRSLGDQDTLVYLEKKIPGWAKQQILDSSRQALYERIPAFVPFLPETLFVDVDARGSVTRIAEKFANIDETFERKVLRQHNLLYRYPKIMQQLWEDAEGSDDNYAIPAAVLLLIEHTGIRPGNEKTGVQLFARDEDGKRVLGEDGKPVKAGTQETYGALTLRSDHVRFRGDKAYLDFEGKAGTQNTAVVSDPRLTNLLKSLKARGGERLFTYPDGSHVGSGNLDWYRTRANPIFDGVNPTDFRKLHAAREFHADLRELSPDLYAKILALRNPTPDKVEALVIEALDRAVARAQKALNHKDRATTIKAYINPELLIHFLNKGKVDETLESTILGKTPVLAFDPNAFVREAKTRRT